MTRSMQCQCSNQDGSWCAEKRVGWFWLVQEDGRLRYICTRHLDRSNQLKVSVIAMRDFLASGGGCEI